MNQEHEMLMSVLIFVDVDHEGIFEQKIYSFLCDNNYKGILLLDDISINDKMIKFWNAITHKKYDFTEIGHHANESTIKGLGAGTGLVDFGGELVLIKDIL